MSANQSDTRPRLAARVGLALVGLALAAGVFFFVRSRFDTPAQAQTYSSIATPPDDFTPNPADYASRVVAFVNDSAGRPQPITRQELGEYLILRLGSQKLPTLINKRIVDHECKARRIEVTAAEVDAALLEKMRGLAVDRATFIRTVLARHKKNLMEFKEDDLRPNLQMSRLVRNRVDVSAADLRKAYESAYGEKVECRLIMWPEKDLQKAQDAYPRLRDDEQAFAEAAYRQGGYLASTGGKTKPIGRYSMDENVEREVFKLRPGMVTPLIRSPQGILLFRCDRRIPPDTTVAFEAVREKLAAEMTELKQTQTMALAFKTMRDKARPQVLLKAAEKVPTGPMPAPTEAVAWLWGKEPITREELGEFLIRRFGAEKLPFLVNRRVIETACHSRGLFVSDAEIDRDLDDYLKTLQPVMDRKVFEKEMLSRMGKTLLEWREDVVRPKLMLGKLAQGRAKCTAEDLRNCYEAHYGERLECRMILWPKDQFRFAQALYPTIRDSEKEFKSAAIKQATPSLAAKAGLLPPFGRNTFGNVDVEREAFRLMPGEVTPLIGTPEGFVVLRCEKRFPANKSVTLEKARPQLEAEVLKKKNELEMQLAFKELYDKASPKLLLKTGDEPVNLVSETKKLISVK